MSQDAVGTAKIFEQLDAKDYVFGATTGTSNRTGTWSRSGATITFVGTAPSFQVIMGTGNFDFIDVNFDGGLIAHIPHTNVQVNEGESIAYTTVSITWKTTDNV